MTDTLWYVIIYFFIFNVYKPYIRSFAKKEDEVDSSLILYKFY